MKKKVEPIKESKTLSLEDKCQKQLNKVLDLLGKAELDIQYYNQAIQIIYKVIRSKPNWYKCNLASKLNVVESYLKYYYRRYNLEDDIMFIEIPYILRRTL